MLRIKLVRSTIGHNKRNRATIQALGLRKMNSVVEKAENPTVMGMIHHVKELLLVERIGEDGASEVVFDARASVKVVAESNLKANEKKRGGDSQQSNA
jgi:large subunit ribosomal protein L30